MKNYVLKKLKEKHRESCGRKRANMCEYIMILFGTFAVSIMLFCALFGVLSCTIVFWWSSIKDFQICWKDYIGGLSILGVGFIIGVIAFVVGSCYNDDEPDVSSPGVNNQSINNSQEFELNGLIALVCNIVGVLLGMCAALTVSSPWIH